MGTDYYWPSVAYFGMGWYHVRRIPPSGWLQMYNASGAPYSDLLSGHAVSLTLPEIIA